MGNVIKRNSVFVEVEVLLNNSASKAGDSLAIFKFEDKWVTRDTQGKCWRMLISILRNEHFFKVKKQYSMSDIIYYLMNRNPDYQTVLWETLERAVNTTFAELRTYGYGIEDIYKYISQNLI